MIECIESRRLAAARHESFLAFVRGEQRKGRDSIGWIPWQGMLRADSLGRILSLWNNDDLVGFLLHGPSMTSMKVYQIWIRQDARLLLHGQWLVGSLAMKALRLGLFRISLWCASDLAANCFWDALGFQKTSEREGGKSSGRTHWRWVNSAVTLAQELQLEEFWQQERLSEHTSPNHQTDQAAAERTAPRMQLTICDPT